MVPQDTGQAFRPTRSGTRRARALPCLLAGHRLRPKGTNALSRRSRRLNVAGCLTLSAMPATFDPDDYELRWPPQLFIDEANRLRGRRTTAKDALSTMFGSPNWLPDIEWLFSEAFVSTAPAEIFKNLPSGMWRGDQQGPSPDEWLSQLLREAATWPELGARKP
jgi:hypothetical protein